MDSYFSKDSGVSCGQSGMMSCCRVLLPALVAVGSSTALPAAASCPTVRPLLRAGKSSRVCI